VWILDGEGRRREKVEEDEGRGDGGIRERREELDILFKKLKRKNFKGILKNGSLIVGKTVFFLNFLKYFFDFFVCF
jgi:hypothetical protein